MANKYIDNQGRKITSRQYLHVHSLGKAYSQLKELDFDGSARLSIDWEGSFDGAIPDYLLTPFRVNVAMKSVTGKFITEPCPHDMRFRTLKAAMTMFEVVSDELEAKFGMGLNTAFPLFKGKEDDIADFGEADVPKDQPRTKSKNLGCW